MIGKNLSILGSALNPGHIRFKLTVCFNVVTCTTSDKALHGKKSLAMTHYIPYSGLFSLGANFPEC